MMTNKIPEYITNPRLPITVTVIGAGGTGAAFCQHLARISYAYKEVFRRRRMEVVVIDGDEVSESNIGRQIYFPSDIRHQKAAILVSRINRAYGYQWFGIDRYFAYHEEQGPEVQSEIIRATSANFIVTCTDTVESRKQVLKMIQDSREVKGYPEFYPFFWIDIGNTRTTGQVVVHSLEMGWPDVISEYEQYYPEPGNNEPSCTLAMALNQQDMFVNSTMALIAAKWLWECVQSKTIDWRGAFVNTDTLLIRKLKVNAETPEVSSTQSKGKQKRNTAGSKRRLRSNDKRQEVDNNPGSRNIPVGAGT